jgi:hypothetical protein
MSRELRPDGVADADGCWLEASSVLKMAMCVKRWQGVAGCLTAHGEPHSGLYRCIWQHSFAREHRAVRRRG